MAEGDGLYTLDTPGNWSGSNPYYTGSLPDGRQLLLGWSYRGMIALWFDCNGRYLGHDEVIVPTAEETRADGGAEKPACLRALPLWASAVGVLPGPIRVQRLNLYGAFGEALDRVSITPMLPQGLDGTYGSASDEQEADRRAGIAAWQAEGCFILHWGDESFCLRGDGSQWD